MPKTSWFFIRALIVAAGLHVACARAQAAPSVFLEALTWTELREQIHAGKTTVIVPIGGTEQSGPHLVLGKHNVRVKVLAEKIALELGNALVAPVVAYVPEGSIDPPAAHMRFAGTISVPEPVFEATLEYAARSFRQHGFRDVVFIGDHGGYQKSLLKVAAKLNRDWPATGTRVHAIDAYYHAADSEYAQLLKRQGFGDAEIGTHAGLADTALSLAIDPPGVRTERLHDGSSLGPAEGVHGDPRRATAALGQSGIDLIVARTVAAVRKAVARNEPRFAASHE